MRAYPHPPAPVLSMVSNSTKTRPVTLPWPASSARASRFLRCLQHVAHSFSRTIFYTSQLYSLTQSLVDLGSGGAWAVSRRFASGLPWQSCKRELAMVFALQPVSPRPPHTHTHTTLRFELRCFFLHTHGDFSSPTLLFIYFNYSWRVDHSAGVTLAICNLGQCIRHRIVRTPEVSLQRKCACVSE